MAPASAVQDPAVSVREKGGRLVLVFNVANVKSGSVHVEHRPESEEEPAGSVHITFASVSPNKQYEKHLVLPHCIDAGKTVKDVQSKSLTVQLVKTDPAVEWGQAWLKPGKSGKQAGKKAVPASPSSGPARSPLSVPASPAAHAQSPPPMALSHAESPPAMDLDGMDDDLVDLTAREGNKETSQLECKEQQDPTQNLSKEQEPKQKAQQTKDKAGKEGASKQTKDKVGKEAKDKENTEPVKKEQKQVEQKSTELKQGGDQKQGKTKKQQLKEVEQSRQDKDKEEQQRKDKEKQTQEQHHDRLNDVEDCQQTGGKKTRRGKSKAQKKKAEQEHDDSTHVAEEIPKAEPDKSNSVTVAASPKTAARRNRSARRNVHEKEKEKTKEDKGFPLLPPSDPEITQLVSDGQSAFQTDPKKATVLLRLAGRKGYLPAYLLLGQLASTRKDEPLMIESLCALLSAPKAEQQLPKDLLSNCAMQLAAVLRDPKNKSASHAHAEEIKRIAKSWPIMQSVMTQDDDVASIRRAVAEKQEELARLSRTSETLQSSQAQTDFSEFDRIKTAMTQQEMKTESPGHSEFDRIKAAMSPKETPDQSEFDRIKAAMSPKEMPDQSEFDRIKAAMNPKEASSQSDFDRIKAAMKSKAPAAGDALTGTWHDEGSSWRFEVQVPGLRNLSDGKLDISRNVIRLQGSDGSNLVLASTPETFDVAKAQATWSRKQSRLEVTSPKRTKIAAPPKPAAMPESERSFESMD
eukprot:TRINITY_DN13300_c0_g1_i1.p1 TRINITY_DN13300_c0_g1~~TRINITY_DN13300_c0_g1_i1.p1  ORF type:complete len:746 (+),score=205.16 TRINITY_DN13300_c0_g1_i1:76-2313(+)